MAHRQKKKHHGQLTRVPSRFDAKRPNYAFLKNNVPKDLLKPIVSKQLINLSDITNYSDSEVLEGSSICALDNTLTGGKGSSLAFLNLIEGVEVPSFFCVTTKAFKRVVSESISIDELQVLCDDWINDSDDRDQPKDEILQKTIFASATSIRNEILKLDFDDNLKSEITNSYKRIAGPGKPVAVRSSATTEDTEDASFAGQHDTFLNQRNIEDILDSIRKCWASIFTDRAVEYRARNKIKHADAIMCVVVQNMVQPRVSGTGFSLELATSFPAYHVAALYGLGEGLVSGEVTSDEWIVDRDTMNVIRQICGSKRQMFLSSSKRSGIELVDTPLKMQNEFCIKQDIVKSIARQLSRVRKVYNIMFGYENIDTEFAVEKKSGKVIFLQCRPVVEIDLANILTADKKFADDAHVLATGNYSLLGAVHGKIKVISDFNLLVEGKCKIGKDDIVVTTKTSNYWNQYLTDLKGIITVEGSPTAHPMLIGRERNLGIICGCKIDILEQLKKFEGEWVTLDGLNKTVFLGKIPLSKCEREAFESRFEPVKVEQALDDNDNIRYLQNMGRVHQYSDTSDTWFVHQPNTYLSPAWRSLMCGQYEAAVDHLKSIRKDEIEFEVPVHRIDQVKGKVASEYLTYEYLLKTSGGPYFGMTFTQCLSLYERIQTVASGYLRACDDFSSKPNLSTWNTYEKTFAALYGALYTHHAFREHVKTQSTMLASDKGVSEFHFDSFQSEYMHGIENQEDDLFRQDIVRIASNLEARIDEATQLDLTQVNKLYPDVALELQSVATRYRLSKDTDISQPAPIQQLFEKVCEAVHQIKDKKLEPVTEKTDGHIKGYFPKSLLNTKYSKQTNDTVWFPEAEYEELREWAMLAVILRIQMCNLHHWKVRGNYKIKHGLRLVEEKTNLTENILNLSLNEIKQAIIDYDYIESAEHQ